jgi:WD40 repeat protein/tRNA A-37 threonylcarbamoyl transferase component Bud32
MAAAKAVMGDKKTCPDCGAVLAADAPDGFCPGCLMGAAAASVAGKDEVVPGSGEAGLGADNGLNLDEMSLLPCDFGEYELLEEIARGGMGVVYKARQKSLDRIVAVKMLLAGQFATKQFVQRFRTEAAAAAALRHPNIVAIHQVGFQSGQYFFSMEYVEGLNLAQLVGQKPLSSTKAATYLKAIAEAIDYAHQQGILHRDLKPSNVLIDSATDQPRVTDFGLARRLDGESTLTVTGQVLGSPSFMPPEQAGGGRKAMGRHSDVYGLGAILYHMVTARAPFQAQSLEATVTQVVNADPIAPRLLNPAVRPDLETICLKCLEKEPSRRYQNARELAEELGRFLNGEPILARPVSRPERAWRWCRRKPALATLGAAALALLLVILVGAPIAFVRIQQARVEAERNLYAADMRLVSEAVKQGAYNQADELLKAHRPAKGQKDLRGFEWRYFWKVLEDQKPVRSLEGLPADTGWEDVSLIVRGDILYNQGGTNLLAWDMKTWESLPLNKPPQPNWVNWLWYPVCDRACAVDNTNATLTVYHLPGFDHALSFPMRGPVSDTALSRNGDLLAAAVQSGGKWRALVWDLRKGVLVRELPECDAAIMQLVFSPDNTLLGVSCEDGVIAIWDLASSAPRPSPPKGENGTRKIQFFPNSRRLLFDDEVQPCRVWDIQTESECELAAGGTVQAASFGFSPDGKFLVTRANLADLTLFDATSLQLIGTLRGHLGLTRGLGYSPDGKLLATASIDQTARVWDLATLREVAVLGGFGERISDVKFSPDGGIVLISGFGALKVYDRSKVVNRGLFATVPDPGGVYSMALSPDRHTLATRSWIGTMTIWDRTTRTPLWSKHLDDGGLSHIRYSPDGNTLAWSTQDDLKMLTVKDGATNSIGLDGTPGQVIHPVAFSPDGLKLAYSCRTQVLVLDLKSQHSRPFARADDEVFGISYSPDGTRLAFGDRLGSLTMCDPLSRQVLFKTNAHRPHCHTIRFSPDGRLLATAGDDALIKLWEVHPNSLTLKHTLRGHRGYPGCSFSPDGTRLVSGASDQMIKLWDVERGVELATLYGHTDYLSERLFAEDGNSLYSTGFGSDRQIRYWEAPPLDQIDAKPGAGSASK